MTKPLYRLTDDQRIPRRTSKCQLLLNKLTMSISHNPPSATTLVRHVFAFHKHVLVVAAISMAVHSIVPATAVAQQSTATSDTLTLSLSDALRRGLHDGEEAKLASAAIEDAGQQVASVRSGVFPQLSGRLGYTRTIRTPFGSGGGFTLPDSLKFTPDPMASIEERLRYLEQNTPNAGLGALSSLFTGLPFGQKNTYIATLSITQTVFDPSVFAGLKIAKEFEQMTKSQATEQRLDVALNIIQAYYDAVLADRLATIVAGSADQLAAQARQVNLVRAAGNASDLDVLRVEVDLQNIEPQRVEALNQRDVALLNLKRLINVPITQPVALTDLLQANGFRAVPDEIIAQLADNALKQREAIAARDREVSIRQQQVSLAKGAYLPTVSMSANFGKQALPSDFVPSSADFKDDWNAGVAVSIPIFSGGKHKADVEIARVQLKTSELQLAQLREAVSLDVAQQRGQLERASALIRARAQTVAQAERVYALTNLSYERGQQTSLELSNSRLQLQQARGNEAQALHDYYIALAKLLRAAGATETEITSRAIQTGASR